MAKKETKAVALPLDADFRVMSDCESELQDQLNAALERNGELIRERDDLRKQKDDEIASLKELLDCANSNAQFARRELEAAESSIEIYRDALRCVGGNIN